MNKLFQEFKPVSTQEWLEVIKKDLKGADFKKLMRKTIDGLEFEPFYRKENTDNLHTTDNLPNKFPFLRGYKTNNNWQIRQDFLFDNIEKISEKIKTAKNKNVDTTGINFNDKFNEDIETLKIIAEKSENIVFEAYKNIEDAFYLVKDNEINFKSAFFNYDPITYKAFTGDFYKDENKIWTDVLDLLTNEDEKLKPLGINLHHYANAGASPVMQLAFGLSIAAEYFNFATEMHQNLEDVLPNIYFNVAIGTEYFMEIAKIRAFRYLYAKLVEAFNPKLKDLAKTHIHGVTIRRNKTAYDAHINMLRTTIETLAGVVGGVDSFSVEPYNTVFAKPDDFADRIAVNQQFIIKEEAYADKVIDPAGGSYYVENLTVKLIEDAWNLFLEIEEKGGFCDALHKNYIFNLIDDLNKKEEKLVETGRISILGTNKFPNKTEKISDLKIEKTLEISDLKEEEANFNTLKISRLAEKFENLRLKTEKADKIPKVFLFTFGHKAMRRARADFAGNFFAVAGFEIIDNLGFDTIDAGINDAKNADIIVLCSNDDNYLEMAKQIKTALPDKIIVIAGNPESRTEIEKVGVTNFIHVKSNIYEELTKYFNL